MTSAGASASGTPDRAPSAAAAPAIARSRKLAPEHQVVVLSVGMTVATALCILGIARLGGPNSAIRDGGWWALPVVAVMFGIFEYTVFNVHIRNEGVSVSLSEVPTAFALVFLPPPVALLARIPLSLFVLVAARRSRYFKVIFNAALFLIEMAAAMLLFRLLVGEWGAGDMATMWSVTIAVVVMGPLSLVLTALAISRFDGNFLGRIAHELLTTWWMYFLNSGTAAMAVGLAVISPALGVLAAAPLAGIWFIQRQFGEQIQRLRDLDAVHGFAGLVGSTLDLIEIGDKAAAETRRLLRAHGAALVRFDGGVTADTHLDGDVPLALPTRIDEPGWADILVEPRARLMAPDDVRRAGIFESVPAAVLVAPIHDEAGPIAVLVAVERPEQSNRFDGADVARVDNLATQLATSLRRGLLHERLEYEARHDALTDLPTRTLFERAVGDAVATYDGRRCVCVLMLDLDRFKEVNDTLGHHAGDEVLVAFASRVGELLEHGDVLSRLAGDEFALLCRRRSVGDVATFAAALVEAAGQPVVVDDLEIVVTASVGVAVINASDRDALQPMRRADIAMYNAKWQRSGVEFYRDEIDRRTPARLSMLGDLRTAIQTDQLDVVYQPKLDIASERVIGLEALVRWEHPNRGVVPPSEFVRVAEDTGLIKELTDFVLARGIAQMAELRRHGITIGIAVNLSTHDLFDGRLPERVRGYLDEHGLPPEALTLEITESSLFVDAPRTRATIDGLHSVGLRMAIDDFGTGYSSLAFLRQLPVHELKIDGTFVTGMLDDTQDEVIVRSTVDLGHNLGLLVVAEGVETLDSLHRLAEIGCDVAQGYCISQPIRSALLPDWLNTISDAHRSGGPMPWHAAVAEHS